MSSTALPTPKGEKFEKHLLKPEDFQDATKTLKILSIGKAEAPFDQFSDLQLMVEMDGLDYVLPLSSEKQNYLMLYERLGTDPSKWIGKTFRARSQYSNNQKQDFVQIVRESKPGKK